MMRDIQLKQDSILDAIRSIIDSKVQYLNHRLNSSIDFYKRFEDADSEHGQRIISQPFPFEMYERTTHEINLLLTLRQTLDMENHMVINGLLNKSRYMDFENSEKLKYFISEYQVNPEWD